MWAPGCAGVKGQLGSAVAPLHLRQGQGLAGAHGNSKHDGCSEEASGPRHTASPTGPECPRSMAAALPRATGEQGPGATCCCLCLRFVGSGQQAQSNPGPVRGPASWREGQAAVDVALNYLRHRLPGLLSAASSPRHHAAGRNSPGSLCPVGGPQCLRRGR